jgi:hypothetical protein
MGNIIQAKVKIKGIRPLFWHKFGPDALPLEKRERTGVAGHDPEEWRRTCLVTSRGQLYLEPTYFFSTAVNGARYTKKGRGSIQSAVAATLQVADDRILIDRFFPGCPVDNFDITVADAPPSDPEQPTYIDIRGVRNPSTKARNVRYRIAVSSGWMCEVNLVWDRTVVSRGELEAALIDSGKLVGIGNGRSIGMGRFNVEKFEVTE